MEKAQQKLDFFDSLRDASNVEASLFFLSLSLYCY